MIKHYYFFNQEYDWERLSLDEWEKLRDGASEKAFTIEQNKEEYISNCISKQDYKQHADLINELCDFYNINKIISFGCGKGILEYYLNEKLYVIYSDFTPIGLNKLKDLFPEINIYCHNLMEDLDLNEIENVDSAIMYRLSTEFNKSEHNTIFSNLYKAGIKNIIYVPTEVLNFNVFIMEKKKHLYNIINGIKDTFCGYIYSESELRRLWNNYYNIEKKVILGNNNCIYFLKSR